MYKKFYISKLLDNIGLRDTQSDSYILVNKLKEEVIDDNITLSSKFDLGCKNDFKTQLVTYLAASWEWSTKAFPKVVMKAFKCPNKQMQVS